MCDGSIFSLTSPMLVIVHLFDYSYPNVCEVVFIVDLICIYMMVNDVKHFSCTYW